MHPIDRYWLTILDIAVCSNYSFNQLHAERIAQLVRSTDEYKHLLCISHARGDSGLLDDVVHRSFALHEIGAAARLADGALA
jgi:hypothetical protein